MLWDLMEWVHLSSQSVQSLVMENQRASDLILLMYLLTIKRSLHFAVAFLACDAAASTNFFDVFNELSRHSYVSCFYLANCFLWCLIAGFGITPNMNRSLAVWCSIMIIFLLLMAWDSWQNADTETFIYSNYATIIVFIHVGIVFSFYRPSATIKLLVDNIRGGSNWILGNYTVQFICYTVSNYTQIMAQKWLVRTRQL